MNGPDDNDRRASDDASMPDRDSNPGASSLAALLRAAPPPPAPRSGGLLRGVQARLRTRSKGKFFADGWSTRDENPRSTYLVTALVMLVLIVLMYVALVPHGVGRL